MSDNETATARAAEIYAARSAKENYEMRGRCSADAESRRGWLRLAQTQAEIELELLRQASVVGP